MVHGNVKWRKDAATVEHGDKANFPRFSINSWRNMRATWREDFGLSLILRFPSISFVHIVYIYVCVCLFIFFSFSFLWNFVKVIIYTVALSDDFIFSCHRLGLNILLTFSLFLIGFTLSVFFVSLVKHDIHYLFILSRSFTFYFRSYSCYGLKFPLLRARNKKKSNIKDEMMRMKWSF